MKSLTYYPVSPYEFPFDVDDCRPELNDAAIQQVEQIAQQLEYSNVEMQNYGLLRMQGEESVYYGTKFTMQKDDKTITVHGIFGDVDIEDDDASIFFSNGDDEDSINIFYIEKDYGLDSFEAAMKDTDKHNYRILL